MVRTYSLKTDGGKALSANFTVGEFACHDGSDAVPIDDQLVLLLQQVRDHFAAPVTVTSGYRTVTWNAKVGGVSGSQHTLGTAADVTVKGVTPLAVAQYAEYLMPDHGGVGVYADFTHLDVRQARSRWDSRSGKETSVAGWPGYTPAAWYESAQSWARALGISGGDLPNDPATRAEVWTMLRRLKEVL